MIEETNKFKRETTKHGLFNKTVKTTFKRHDLSSKDMARLSKALKSLNVHDTSLKQA